MASTLTFVKFDAKSLGMRKQVIVGVHRQLEISPISRQAKSTSHWAHRGHLQDLELKVPDNMGTGLDQGLGDSV